jgi:hypothetical protein
LKAASNLDDPQQLQDDEDQGDNQQDVDDIARARKTGKEIGAEVSEQPEYDEDYDDPGKHEISPFERLAHLLSMWTAVFVISASYGAGAGTGARAKPELIL